MKVYPKFAYGVCATLLAKKNFNEIGMSLYTMQETFSVHDKAKAQMLFESLSTYSALFSYTPRMKTIKAKSKFSKCQWRFIRQIFIDSGVFDIDEKCGFVNISEKKVG